MKMEPARKAKVKFDIMMDLAVVDLPKPGKAQKPAKPVENGLPAAPRGNDQEVGNTLALPVSTRKGDRHSKDYQRDMMRARRAIKAGRADRYPRTVN